MEWQGIVSIVAAVGAVAAAGGAWKSARETRRTSQAQMVMQIMAVYSSPEMLEALKNLHWHQEHTPDLATQLADGTLNHSKRSRVEQDTRLVANYFHRLRLLLEIRLVDGGFVKRLITPDQARFLLQMIEPIDKAQNANYDRSTYDVFRSLFPDAGRPFGGRTHV